MGHSFWVIAQDGQAYGPADEATLGQWAREGRLTSQSTLQDATTNARLMAGQVPGLAGVFSRGASAVAAPGYQQPVGYQQSHTYQQPVGYQQQQTALPMAAAYGLADPASYQQPVGYQQAGYPQQAAYPQAVQYANPYAPAHAAAHALSSFSVVGAVLLHWVTFGLFSYIFHQLKHGHLPVVRHDDPSGGKAAGFMFIPFFNIWYWNFFTNLRLCDRLNEQRRFAGLPETAPRGLALAYAICMAIPYINVLVGFTIMGPIYYGTLQANVNELVRATRGPAA